MRHCPDTVMMFCAGRGTRMGPLTRDRAKPMVSVAGRPLVDHALDIVSAVPRRFANTHSHPDLLEAHLGKRGVKVIRETTLLETGGGLKNAAPQLARDACFTLNTDAVWIGGNGVQTLANIWDPSRMDALLLVVPCDRTRGHSGTGDFTLSDNGRLSRGGEFVYTGLQIIRLAKVAEIEDSVFSLNLAWSAMSETGRLFGAVYDGEWCDVGHPEGIDAAEQALTEVRDVSSH